MGYDRSALPAAAPGARPSRSRAGSPLSHRSSASARPRRPSHPADERQMSRPEPELRRADRRRRCPRFKPAVHELSRPLCAHGGVWPRGIDPLASDDARAPGAAGLTRSHSRVSDHLDRDDETPASDDQRARRSTVCRRLLRPGGAVVAGHRPGAAGGRLRRPSAQRHSSRPAVSEAAETTALRRSVLLRLNVCRGTDRGCAAGARPSRPAATRARASDLFGGRRRWRLPPQARRPRARVR